MTEDVAHFYILDRYITRLGDDPFFFVGELWRANNMQPVSALQMDLIDWVVNGPDRGLALGFRGMSKSFICSAICLYMLYRNLSENIMICSGTIGQASRSIHLMKRWMNRVDFLRHLFPNRKKKPPERDHKFYFDVAGNPPSASPSVFGVGMEGTLPGYRATFALGDDVETPNNCATPDYRYKLDVRSQEFESICKPESRILYIGTPYHKVQSVYYKLEQRGYACREWPMIIPTASEEAHIHHISPWYMTLKTSGFKPGQTVWPEYWSQKRVDLKKSRLLEEYWQGQYMMMRGTEDDDLHTMIRMEDFIVHPVQRDVAPVAIVWGKRHQDESTMLDIPCEGFAGDAYYAPIFLDTKYESYHSRKMYVDPSGGGRDETAWAIGGQLYGNVFVMKVGAYLGPHIDENLMKLAMDARNYLVHEIVVESNYGGDTIAALLKSKIDMLIVKAGKDKDIPMGWGCIITPRHNSKSKPDRILDHVGILSQQHRLIIDPSVARDKILARQLTRTVRPTPGERHRQDQHDDRADALAGLCQQFRERMDFSNEKVLQMYENRLDENDTMLSLRESLKKRSRYCF